MLLDYSFQVNSVFKISCPVLFLRQSRLWSKPANLVSRYSSLFLIISNWVTGWESIPHVGLSFMDATPWVGTHPVCPNFVLVCLFPKTTSFNHVGWKQEIRCSSGGESMPAVQVDLAQFQHEKDLERKKTWSPRKEQQSPCGGKMKVGCVYWLSMGMTLGRGGCLASSAHPSDGWAKKVQP